MLHQSQKLLFTCLTFILGVFCASLFSYYLFYIIIIFLIIVFCFIKNINFSFIILICLIFCLSIFYYQQFLPDENLINKNLIIQDLVTKDPDFRDDYTIYTLSNNILVYADIYPAYQYGDLIKVNGQTEQNKYNKKITFYHPQITLLEKDRGNLLLSKIYKFRNKSKENLYQIFPTPSGEFMAGLLLGLKKELPEQIQQYFKITGTIHILVISGLHILIISSILSTGLKHLYIPRPKKIYFMALILILFVIFTGASPSVIRATLMALAVLLAEKVGRPKTTFNILVLVATFMILNNPLILVHDMGFQLSFLATLGLVYLSGPIEKFLIFIPKFLGLRSLLAASLSAILLTNPLIVYSFGTFSTIAPLANLLIVPFIPLVMTAGLFILVVSFLWMDLAVILGWNLTLVINFIINLAKFLASFEWASIVIGQK